MDIFAPLFSHLLLVELVILWKTHIRAGRGWSGDAQTKPELEMAETEMHTAWQKPQGGYEKHRTPNSCPQPL